MKNAARLLLALIIVLLGTTRQASAQGQSREINGLVVEDAGGSPVGYATVVLKDLETDVAVAGVTTAEDGTFVIRTSAEDFYIEVRFIGFANWTRKDLPLEERKIDLGTIRLKENEAMLDDVEIRAERSQTVFKLDKRVYNVGQDLTSTGASALEVLDNVPSVNVSIEGEVSLRGSNGVQILINGKPSVLATDEGNALGTITADMLERVEVITNPSAKYEAEGTAGIINIVLKKEDRKGANGSVSLNTGWPHNHSLGFSLNRRTEKFNLFSQLGAGYRSLPTNADNINRDLLTGTSILSNGREFRDETFFNIVLGTDYHLNEYNVFTLSGSFAYEIEQQPSTTNFRQTDSSEAVIAAWERTETTAATNPKWQYELQYARDFKDSEDHKLIISALGNFFGKDLSSDFQNLFLSGGLEDEFQQTATDFSEARYTFKADYTHPFSKKLTLESGSQYVIQDVRNDFTVSNLINDVWVPDSGFTNVFSYVQKVFGVYSTGAYEGDRWGIKLGLRLENTDLQTLLETTNESGRQQYTNLFPTAHTSYKFTERFSVQAGYSRRIFRPRLWDLNPFFNIRNNFSIRTGNPDLLPEFTDSYELNGIYILDKLSLNLGVFYRYTTDQIERVSTFENNVNLFQPVNVGTNSALGLEANFKYTPIKRLVFNGDAMYQYFTREGSWEGASFDFAAGRWNARLTTKVKFPADIDLEITGNYESSFRTIQGTVGESWALNTGLRKQLLKGKAVINLSARDIFATRVRQNEISQPNFYIYSFRQRGRFLTLGFSYGFGKGEAMEYSGRRRR